MDLAKAQKAIKAAWIAGVVRGLLNVALITYSLTVRSIPFFNLWAIPDVVVLFGLCFGIYKKSRTCAVLMVCYYVWGCLAYVAETQFPNLAFAAVFLYFFFQGMRGTFAYHRLMGQADAAPPGGVPPDIEDVRPVIPNDTSPAPETAPVHGYFILRNGQAEGPYNLEELRALWSDGSVTGETFFCEEGYKKWVRLGSSPITVAVASCEDRFKEWAGLVGQPESPTPPPLPPPLPPTRTHNPAVSAPHAAPPPVERTGAAEHGASFPAALSPSPPLPIATRKNLMQPKKKVLVFGAAAFLICGIFPPWVFVPASKQTYGEKHAGYGLLFKPPSPRGQRDLAGYDHVQYSSKVDMSRLGIEWACVCVLSGAAWFLVPKSTRGDEA